MRLAGRRYNRIILVLLSSCSRILEFLFDVGKSMIKYIEISMLGYMQTTTSLALVSSRKGKFLVILVGAAECFGVCPFS